MCIFAIQFLAFQRVFSNFEISEELLAKDFQKLVISSQRVADSINKRLPVQRMVSQIALNGITKRDVFE